MMVLVLEDSGSVFSSLQEIADVYKIELIKAYQVSDAKDIFDLKRDSIDFIIADLNVSPVGLTREEINQTKGGILSGWVWLRNYVLKNDKAWENKILIYSEYVMPLKYHDKMHEFENIKLMEKSRYSIEDVISYVNYKTKNK